MTNNVGFLDWQSTGGNGQIANLSAIYSIDKSWQVSLYGSDKSGLPILVRYVVVDNLNNSTSVIFSYSTFTFNITPYSRKTFPILVNSSSCSINISSGTAYIQFCNFNPKIPDEDNLFAIQSKGLIFVPQNRFISISGNYAALLDDEANIVSFADRNDGGAFLYVLKPLSYYTHTVMFTFYSFYNYSFTNHSYFQIISSSGDLIYSPNQNASTSVTLTASANIKLFGVPGIGWFIVIGSPVIP